jgi:aminoglycoside phosphotransferase (APT) family kinase protein
VSLTERVLAQAQLLVGGTVRLAHATVDHPDRCVLLVVGPDGTQAFVKGDLDPARSAREARVLDAAGRAGVPVPRVVASAVARTPGVLMLEPIGGEWLAPERSPAAWQSAGRVLRRLHGTLVPGLRHAADQADWWSGTQWMLDHFEPWCRETGLSASVLAGVRTAVRALADERPRDGGFDSTLHGDCMPIHVRVDGAESVVGLLDLGESSLGDPAWDLVVLTLRSPGHLPAVLEGYGADTRLQGWVEKAAPSYRAFRLLIEAGWLAEHGFDASGAVRDATAAAAAVGRSGAPSGTGGR